MVCSGAQAHLFHVLVAGPLFTQSENFEELSRIDLEGCDDWVSVTGCPDNMAAEFVGGSDMNAVGDDMGVSDASAQGREVHWFGQVCFRKRIRQYSTELVAAGPEDFVARIADLMPFEFGDLRDETTSFCRQLQSAFPEGLSKCTSSQGFGELGGEQSCSRRSALDIDKCVERFLVDG